MTIVKKIVGDNKKGGDSKIKFSLWEDRIAKKIAMGNSPFQLFFTARM